MASVALDPRDQLTEIGLRVGDRVRFRAKERGRWHEGVVSGRHPDGSVDVRDERGASRALRLERLEVRRAGRRGSPRWEAATTIAADPEQLGLW
jgi:hypothetical protein